MDNVNLDKRMTVFFIISIWIKIKLEKTQKKHNGSPFEV